MDISRSGRRGVPADRRPGQSGRHHPGAGQGRAHAPACAIFEDARVTAIRGRGRRRVSGGADRPRAAIACEIVVNCAGPVGAADRRAGRRQRAAGVGAAPVSDHRADRRRRRADLPTLRDPDRLTYFKEEVGGLVMGGYEPNPIALGAGRHSRGFQLPAARRRLGPFRADPRCRRWPRVPALATAGIKRSSTGRRASPPTATSSSARRRSCAGFFVGAGFNAFGIASGGGAGQGAGRMDRRRRGAHGSLAGGHPPLRARRTATSAGCATRTLEAYGKHYTIAWPGEEYASGRPLRVSPLYERLQGAGRRASAKSSAGSGRTGSPPAGEAPRDDYSFGRPNWFAAVAREHQAARERVGDLRPELVREIPAASAATPSAALSWICRQRRGQAGRAASSIRRC